MRMKKQLQNCPRCGAIMTPHMGEENGKTDSWGHPVSSSCIWSEFEGITNRQVSGVLVAQQKRLKTP